MELITMQKEMVQVWISHFRRIFNSKLLRYALFFIALYFFVIYIIMVYWRIQYPFELEWMEGGFLLQVRRVLQGMPIYQSPSLEYIPYIYTPLYFYVSALASLLGGSGFLSLRAVSFLSSLGCFFLIYLFVKKETGNTYAAVIAFSLFAATFRLSGAWFDVARVDSLGLLCCLATLYLLRFGRRFPSFLAAGALLTLCYLSKQSLLIVFPSVLLLGLIYRFRSMLLTAITAGALVGASTIVLDLLHGGWYSFYTIHLPSQHKVREWFFLEFWQRDIVTPFAVAVGLSLFFLVRQFLKRDWKTGVYYLSFAIGLTGASWAGRLNQGGSHNSLMPVHAAIAVLVGLALATILSLTESSSDLVRMRIRAAVFLLCISQFVLLFYDPVPQIPTADDLRAGEELLAFIRESDSKVLMPFAPYLPEMAGKGTSFHFIALQELIGGFGGQPEESGIRILNEIKAAILERKFGAVIIHTDWMSNYLEQSYQRRDLGISRCFRTFTSLRRKPCYLYVPKEDSNQPQLAYIELYIQPALRPYWAVVQWQDGLGDWHDVEGWAGKATEGLVVWAVFPSEFGKGPFRWAVYDDHDDIGNTERVFLGASGPFYLPELGGESIKSEVIIGARDGSNQ